MLGRWRRGGPSFGRRNMSGREDIDSDVPLQRRDLYAVAIGLVIYNLGGGYAVDSASVGVLPMRLSHPGIVLLAAWVGLAYFWWRFWLISEVKPFGAWHEDAVWQTGQSRRGRALAARHAATTQFYNAQPRSSDENAGLILLPTGPVPRFSVSGAKPVVNLMELHRDALDRSKTLLAQSYGPSPIKLPPGQRLEGWRVILSGYWRAIWRERAFSDYTAPHLFAIFTVVTGVARYFLY